MNISNSLLYDRHNDILTFNLYRISNSKTDLARTSDVTRLCGKPVLRRDLLMMC